MSVRKALPGRRWEGTALLAYKRESAADSSPAPFRDVTRQTLFESPAMAGELRYFEVAAGGWSTLERHRHEHAVVVLHGRGRCLVELAFGWLLSNPLVGGVIAGASTPEQVRQNVSAAAWQLTTAEITEIDELTRRKPS